MVRDLTMSAAILAAFACPAFAQDPAAGDAASENVSPVTMSARPRRTSLAPSSTVLMARKPGLPKGSL